MSKVSEKKNAVPRVCCGGLFCVGAFLLCCGFVCVFCCWFGLVWGFKSWVNG